VVVERRIAATRDRLTAVFGRAPMRILLERGGGSEWVAQHLESLGHEVVVADPNYTLMYGARRGRVKTDRRDVAALAEANRHGLYRPAHRCQPPNAMYGVGSACGSNPCTSGARRSISARRTAQRGRADTHRRRRHVAARFARSAV
jgi:transposase